MSEAYTDLCRVGRRWSLVLLVGLAGPKALRAQESCMLVPVPLSERVAAAPLIVEAGVSSQAVQAAEGHLYTLSKLTIYKVFRGTAPAVLQLAEAGGTLGLRREVVSPGVTLAPSEQALFLLEPNPTLPGSYRLVAGPQGCVRYDLTDHSAAEPFGRYASIAGSLYPAVEAATGQPLRTVQANVALQTVAGAARPQAQPAVSSFAPSQITAGKDLVITINGVNFGATRGFGRVDFPNANNGGTSFVSANPTDYLAWSDTQIRVRVPSFVTATGGVAGTGLFRVVNDDGTAGSSPSPLTVTYALTNAFNGGLSIPSRPRLISRDGAGGYTLQYSPSFTAVAGASAAFERALDTWACASRLRRVVSSTAAPDVAALDGVSAVRFGTLSLGVLGLTFSYYSGCTVGGVVQFWVDETDYTFAPTPSPTTTWNFSTSAPGSTQYDFESVAVHEQGHGHQLSHIIDSRAVMHYVIGNGVAKRLLSTPADMAGAQDVFTYSLSNPCGEPVPVATPAPSTPCPAAPLPVELISFTARYEVGRGTQLVWATASEHNSAYFALEAHDPDAEGWPEVLRTPAAGNATAPRRYAAVDLRPLAGTRYYRLRQVDLDGTVAYSPVVAVDGPETGLALYPNPVTTQLQVLGPGRAGRLVLYDAVGREVARFALAADTGEVDVSGLPAGLYQAEWTDGATVRRSRIQKQ